MTSNELEIFKQSILDDVRVMMQTTGQVTQYIGARYVPLFAEPFEWSDQKEYEPLTIVTHQGNSFTSRQFVPKGISINNAEFWASTGNYNAQIEQYRREVAALSTQMGTLSSQVDTFDARITAAQNTADSKAPVNHQSSDTTYGVATTNKYGHVKITTSIDDTADVPTSKAVNDKFNEIAPKPPVIACIGDSFLQGFTNEGTVTSWGTVLAQRLNTTPHNYALGGVGFVNEISGKTLNTLINEAYDATPTATLVVIGGGYNDSKSSVDALYTAAKTAIQNAHSKWPNADIWMFPNLWGKNNYGVNSEDHANAIVNAIKDLAYNNVHYIQGCWTWLYLMDDAVSASDGLHPNEKGQKIIAESMYAAMNGGDPTIYTQNFNVSKGGSAYRNYLTVGIVVNGINGSNSDVVMTLPDKINLQFALGTGMGTISGAYKPVFFTTENNTVKIFHADGHVDANGYCTMSVPMQQK